MRYFSCCYYPTHWFC